MMDLNQIQIREAALENLPTLKLFEQKIIRYERPFAPNLKDNPITYYDIENLIEREDAQVLIAMIDNEIVGSGYALIEDSAHYEKSDKYAYLGLMYVVPEHRGKGISGRLTQQLIEWATVHDISEIQLDVYNKNENAIAAYTKIGFKPDLLKMRLNTSENF